MCRIAALLLLSNEDCAGGYVKQAGFDAVPSFPLLQAQVLFAARDDPFNNFNRVISRSLPTGTLSRPAGQCRVIQRVTSRVQAYTGLRGI